MDKPGNTQFDNEKTDNPDEKWPKNMINSLKIETHMPRRMLDFVINMKTRPEIMNWNLSS